EALELVALRAVADEHELRVDAERNEACEGREHVRDALDPGHAPDPADDEARVRDAEPATQRPAGLRAGDAALEIDAEPDHGELLRRCDAEAHELVPYLRPDRDQPRRVLGEEL